VWAAVLPYNKDRVLQNPPILPMNSSEIKAAVKNLSRNELTEFLDWLDDYQESLWDQQIAEDMNLGKLNHLIEEARKEFREGKCRQI
jgi:hypothetical protein